MHLMPSSIHGIGILIRLVGRWTPDLGQVGGRVSLVNATTSITLRRSDEGWPVSADKAVDLAERGYCEDDRGQTFWAKYDPLGPAARQCGR